ncbi:glycosyltransferase family 4 protein [Pustulibacterium marinum]|uniref:glycosyltransferase family 4 protein n=1 Tax=Pustulibacterium marinum TaxID=1224947 RepID=UPI0015A61229|nr:glycosyltransferase family 4 protein [Pustulibacterium marinum]
MNGTILKFREFSVFNRMYKGLIQGNIKEFGKQFINLFFMLSLLFTKNKKVVLGIAPYDYKLNFLLYFLKNHQLYYHTSWTFWDGKYYPKKKRVTPDLLNKWKFFLEEKSKHIFAVSAKSKAQLIKYYEIPSDKVSLVYHTVDPIFYKQLDVERDDHGFIFLGRFEEDKGLMEAIHFFKDHPLFRFTLVGKGSLEEEVKQIAATSDNIFYQDFLDSKEEIAKFLQSNTFLVLNSKRSKEWEELFGVAIIEAMASKTIPIATSHSGPKEVISNGVDGFLLDEDEIIRFFDKLEAHTLDIEKLQKSCYKRAQDFTIESIATKWNPIFKD